MKNLSKIIMLSFFCLFIANLAFGQNVFKRIAKEIARTPNNIKEAPTKIKEEAERVYDRERSRPDPEPTNNRSNPYVNQEELFSEVIYFTRTCTYDVYVVKQSGGSISCDDWEYVGTVSPGEHVKVTCFFGETLHIRVAYDGEEPCGKLKENATLFLNRNATQSTRNTIELHDWTCR